MIKLRVVGSSEDHSELILSNKPRGKRGSHSVAIDKKLLGVLQDAVYGRKEMEKQAAAAQRALEPRAEPKLPPREIQRQLRAGLSPAQVAKAADVDEEYVDQFYTPILYERMGVVQEVQGLSQEKPRLGASGLPLGEAVRANLATRRVNLTDEALQDAWSATRSDSQPWVITLTFPFRGRSRIARWRYDPRTRDLTPTNKLATDVGWVSPGTKRAPSAKREGLTASGASRARGSTGTKATPGAVKKKGSKRSEKSRKPAKRKPTRKAAPKRKPVRKAAPKRSTRTRKAAPKRKPVRKAAPKRSTRPRKAAPKRKPARKAAAKRSTRTRKAAPRRRKPAPKKATVGRKSAARKPAARRTSGARRTTSRRRR